MAAVALPNSTQPMPSAEASTPHFPFGLQQPPAVVPTIITLGHCGSGAAGATHLFCVKPDMIPHALAAGSEQHGLTTPRP